MHLITRNTVRICVTIRKDQRDWLVDHPEVNVSGLLQRAIDLLMETPDPLSDLKEKFREDNESQ